MKFYSTLDRIAESYSEDRGFDSILMKYKIMAISEFINGKTMLDIGCGVGTLTKAIADNFESVVGIDGSSVKLNKARDKNQGANIEYDLCLFENFSWRRPFDFIVCTNVLEHLDDGPRFLKQVKKILSPDGLVVLTVPNALGLHKRIGKAMGLIEDFYKLTPADFEKGHKRVYDTASLKKDLLAAGFKIVHIGGILLKPLSHTQMESWDPKIIDALYEVGKEIPEYCASLLITASH